MSVKTKSYYINLLREHKQILEREYGITRVGIFGSVATERNNGKSDVDVCVEMKKPDMFLMIDAKNDLQKLFHCDVDIVRLRNNMNPFLYKIIRETAIYA
ncbi:MAG: nucleotidyltransferase domain-containing protein [Tannerella sp.]|jgi:predicted nucleotidyltransferase|nr:nucleotidyltransferase domain-containing protein [Tannerella sp.]